MIADGTSTCEAHPHYTPSWLSEQLVRNFTFAPSATFLDPACGSGNLLVAAHNLSSKSGVNAGFIGIDTRRRALSDLERVFDRREAFAELLAIQKNFLCLRRSEIGSHQNLYFVMNPPFSGYGVLTPATRKLVARKLGLAGRYNLAHAFVAHAIREFNPKELVALLPCTWARSSSSGFRDFLNSTFGTWNWCEIESNPFADVSTQVGVLHWKSGNNASTPESIAPLRGNAKRGMGLKTGLATGRDEVFRSLAGVFAGTSIGSVVASVRGRDVGRDTYSHFWLPPSSQADRKRAILSMPENFLRQLDARSCVTTGRRSTLEFHERLQGWFLGKPKVILPEINTGSALRICVDLDGRFLPLHSTLAIQCTSRVNAAEVGRILSRKGVAEQLRRVSPRLQGASFRLTVGALRTFISSE